MSTPNSRPMGPSTSQSENPLRGCSLSSLIWDASLLRSSEDCTNAYNMAVPVNSVDIFLSHAWSDSGWWKQAALLTCCTPAIIYKVTVVSCIVGVWLCWYLSYKWSSLVVLLIGFVSFIVSIITLLLVKHRNTTVFLDKCCINQVDFAEKMRDISRLSDYLRASDKLIILWTPNYLDRLWCVYELAVFMQTHDEKDVILINLRHVKPCLSLLLLQLIDVVIIYALGVYGEKNISYSSCDIVLGVATSVLLGREAFGCLQDWSTFSSKLNAFSVSNAKCTSPDDSTKLKRLIAELYGSAENFAAYVRSLCLGIPDENPAPLWLFSKDSLRIWSIVYIPPVSCSIVAALLDFFVGNKLAAGSLSPQGANHSPLPSFTLQVLWSFRSHAFPLVIQFFRIPFMLIVGHRLALRGHNLRQKNPLLLRICYCIICVLYTCVIQALCGLRLYDHPFVGSLIRPPTTELLLLVIGVFLISVLFIGVSRSYTHDVSNSILEIGN